MMKISILALLIAAPSIAAAADLPPMKDFSPLPGVSGKLAGVYVAGLGGYEFVDTTNEALGLAQKLETASTGFTFTGRTGIDFAVTGPIIAGIYGEAGYNDVYGSGILNLREKWNYGGGVRAGVRWGTSFVYGIAGYTRQTMSINAVGAFAGSDKGFDGFKYGGGFETPVYKNLSLVVEVTETAFDTGKLGSSLKYTPESLRPQIGMKYAF